jgi:hypothetical protein
MVNKPIRKILGTSTTLAALSARHVPRARCAAFIVVAGTAVDTTMLVGDAEVVYTTAGANIAGVLVAVYSS